LNVASATAISLSVFRSQSGLFWLSNFYKLFLKMK